MLALILNKIPEQSLKHAAMIGNPLTKNNTYRIKGGN